MKNAFVLRGVGNSGKTTTISKQFYPLFKQNYPDLIEVYRDPRKKIELIVVVEVDGVLIGITSLGDTVDYVQKCLDIFLDHGCEIIVCATKSDGETVATLEKIKPDFQVEYVKKIKDANDDAEVAQLILNSVQTLLRT
ncbi:hypothetical protein KW497_10975 [Vibrio fluvialis]|nr:hypothetical protein [Vibrio fluvialis]